VAHVRCCSRLNPDVKRTAAAAHIGATPLPSMVAAAALDEDQVTSAVRFWAVLLEKVPVAMNAWVVAAAMDANPWQLRG
jgi:hypothetical protein